MRYKLVKLDANHPVDARLIEQGFVYRPVQCTDEEEQALTEINALVSLSRQNLRKLYSGTLSEEEFDKALQILADNDEIIQRLAATVEGVEFAYLNPFASGRGFIED